MVVMIARQAMEEILAHAAASPDEEVCGLLLGTSAQIDRAVRAANVHTDRARHFEVDPSTLFAVIRNERAEGPKMVGHYHSHPSGTVAPSAQDAADAEPGRLWLIVAGAAAGLWLSTGTGFEAVDMEITG